MRWIKILLSLVFGVLFVTLAFNFSPFEKSDPSPLSVEKEEEAAPLAAATAEQKGENQPILSYFTRPLAEKLKVSASAYLVGDLETGEIIFSKNEKEELPIASVSKLMTALVATETLPKDAAALVSKGALATEGGNGDLRLGEKIKSGDLLYPLLLQSSNDAAEVLAEDLGRSIFIGKMNERAKELLMFQTKYSDPSGLSVGNKSTVSDLFRLAKHLFEKEKGLLDLTTLRSYGTKAHIWPSNNQFLKKEGYLGGKSGYTEPARQTVVSLFSAPLLENGPRNVGIALLGSSDRKRDVENILGYLKKNVYYGEEMKERVVFQGVEEVVIAPIPEIKEPDYVMLAFGGDLMLNRGVRNSVMKNFGGDYSALFEKMDILRKSDIVFANLEGTASDQGNDLGNLYSFRMDPQVLPALKGAGFSILSVANNHIGDWGRLAFYDTLSRMKENEILYTGGGITRDEAERPAIIEKYGMKIGFLGFSDKGPEFMRAGTDNGGILLANDPRFDEIVARATSQVDYLIVSFHFGEEYQTKHNARQEELARRAIDAGAKVVVGTHPHVMQDSEVYKNGYIAYSLGNFIFDQTFSEATMQGMFLEVKLFKDGNMTVKKNILKLSRVFQPDKIILGKEEKVKFE